MVIENTSLRRLYPSILVLIPFKETVSSFAVTSVRSPHGGGGGGDLSMPKGFKGRGELIKRRGLIDGAY